jgi:mono/diheme cytochrome c family protein
VSDGQVTLSADASDAAGNVGQSVPVTVTVSNVVAVTLTQLQSTIFTPRCSGCHTGGGGGLPSSMNLSSRAATFAALVNVASVEQSGVLRVMPGDASASYVVRKLEGDASITGVRMPQGGPFLSAAEIDKVKQWINAGASNN